MGVGRELSEGDDVSAPVWFPIMNAPPVPWALMAACERQAQANHGQSINQLARRGGLASSEAVALLEGRRWQPMAARAADARLQELVTSASADAIEQLREAREALGLGWISDGVSLAAGIRRKTAALEALAKAR